MPHFDRIAIQQLSLVAKFEALALRDEDTSGMIPQPSNYLAYRSPTAYKPLLPDGLSGTTIISSASKTPIFQNPVNLSKDVSTAS